MADPKNRYITFLDKEALKAGEEKLIRINEADYNNEYGTFEEYAKAQNATIYNTDGVEWDPTYDTKPEAVQQLDEVVVEAPKGKFATEKEQQAKNIQDNLSKITPETTKDLIAKEYFNLDDNFNPKIDRKWKPKVVNGVPTQAREYVNDYETDLKNNFNDDKKYNLWKSIVNKAQKEGVKLNKENIGGYFSLDDIDEKSKQTAVLKEKNYQSDQYLRGLDENERKFIEPYLFEGELETKAIKELQRATKLQKEKDEFYGNEEQWNQELKKRGLTPKDLNPDYSSIKNEFNQELKKKTKEYDDFVKGVDTKAANWQSFVNGKTELEKRIEGFNTSVKNNVFENEQEQIAVRNQLVEDIEKFDSIYTEDVINAQWEDLNSSIAEAKNKYDELNDALIQSTDIDFALSSLSKNYDKMDKLALVMEESFLGSAAMLTSTVAADLGNLAMFMNISPTKSRKWYQDLLDNKTAAINYNQKLRKKKETQFPQDARYGDEGYWGDVLINNSPSILVALGTGFAGVGGASALATAANVSTGVFFTMEAGQQLSNLEIGQREAPKVIADLEEALKDETNLAKRNELLKEIDNQKSLLKYSQFQKAFNAYTYGGIASLAERFGTLSVIKNFQKLSKGVGLTKLEKVLPPSIARATSQGLGIASAGTTGIGVETVEETVTKIGQNFADIVVLGKEKTLIDGLDPEFFRNVAATSLAIYGPMATPNVYTAVSNELKLRSEAKQEAIIRDQLMLLQEKINKTDLRSKEGRQLLGQRNSLLKELEKINTNIILKAGKMSNDEIEAVFENGKRIRELRREAEQIGNQVELTEYDKQRFGIIKGKAQKLFDINQKILGKPTEKFKDLDVALQMSRFFGSTNLVKNLKGINLFEINKDNYQEFISQKKNEYPQEVLDRIEKNALAIQNKESGANAMNENNDVIVFTDNVPVNIQAAYALGLDMMADVFSVSPIHEVGHIQTRKAGIIKDGKLSEEAKNLADEISSDIEQRFRNGEITKENYQNFLSRMQQYSKASETIFADEMLQLIAEMQLLGILPKNKFNFYSAKQFVNSLLTKFNGDQSYLFRIESPQDAYDFISSWQEGVFTAQTAGAPEEDKSTEIKESKGVSKAEFENTVKKLNNLKDGNNTVDLRTKPEVFEALPTMIEVQINNLAATFDNNTKEELISDVQLRVLDQNKQGNNPDLTFKGIGQVYGFLNDRIRKRLLDALKADRESISPKYLNRLEGDAIEKLEKRTTEDSPAPKQQEKPTYKTISKSNIFSTSALDQIKNKLVSTVRVLKSKINAPTTINQTVKPIISEIKTEMGKQADIIIKKDAGGLQNKRLEKVFLKSKKATLENAPTTWLAKAMPFAVQKSVGGKYTGEFVIDPTTNKKVEVFKPNFINDWQGKKIDRVKTLGTGQTSGNQFIKRKPNVAQKVTDEQFMSYMFKFDNDGNATEIIRGRKESWSKMMAEEISFELIDDALNDLTSPIAEELIKNQARLGVEIVENFAQQVRKDIDRGTVKESKGLASFTPSEMDRYTSSQGWADFKNKMAAAEGKYRENTIYRFHKESFLETYPDKLQKEIAKQFFVKLKNYGDVESIKVQLKEDNSSLPEYLEDIRSQIDFNETVRQITNAEASIPVLNDNKVYVADTQQYVIDQAKGEDVQTIIAFFSPTFANSGKIGRERQGVIGKVSRADLFYNQKHVISSLNEAGFNIDKVTKTKIILKDGTVLPREFTATAKVEQKHLDGTLDINKEIEIAGKAWDFMMKLIKGLKNQPSHVQALTLASMNSGTNTVLRVAAPVLNVSTVLPSKIPSDYRYEHRPPARVVMALAFKSEVLGDKNINIEALKNDYQVSIIPVTMDKVIGKIGLGQSTIPDYKPGITPATNDYYNAFTKNKPGIVSIKNLKTGEIIGKDYEASSKLKNQPTVKDAVAQPKQPKESTVKESKGLDLSKEINNMIARQKGVKAEATYSEIVARKKGAGKGALKFFLPATAEDFRGLTSYTFAGKGKQGEADQKFFEDNLVKPYIKGVAAMESARQALKNDYRGLLQMYPEVKKSLNKEIGKTGFTLDQAIRAYLYEKSGNEVPGISKRDLKLLTDTINNNENYKGFADGLLAASKKDSWVKPDPYWDAGSILKDLNDMDQNVNRAEYLQEFIENVDIIFDKQNLNKIEALYGSRHREALEDIIRRMKSGSNRPPGTGDRQTTAWLNWVNNSVGTIMFFNRRSALLQMISFANFTNWSDNNPLMAAKAFANQPAYWKAWVEIFNSDKLKQRRGGLKSDVQEQEIANQAKNSPNKVQAAISYLLKIGFTPTQIADSVAIATGGATFLINRTNTYQKQGMSYEDARAKAFEDFSAISDETQQSGDPMLISKQQAGHLGRFILSFQNTPMQYTRLMKKAGQDLINGRGDWKTNVSKILYYGFIQNLIFAGLQNALFALLPEFDPEEEEEAYDKQKNNKYNRIINSMIDTILRGSGLAGAVVATLKNAIRRYNFEEAKGFTGDHAYTLLELANVSPPIGSKLRKVYGAIQTKRFDQDILDERGLAPDSPAYEIIANLLSAGANIPLDRALAEVRAIAEALDSDNTAMQRLALALGWRTWDVNIRNEEHELIKTQAKARRKEEGIKKAKETRKRNAELKKEILIKLSKENQKEYIRYLGMSTKDKNEYIKKEIEKLNK